MKRAWKMRAVAFLTPVFLWMLIFAVWGQWPFGENTLLFGDMNWQYASFFSHLHDMLHGEASVFYSFSRAIGGDMAGVSAYYLMSPFNLIFFFFDAAHIYQGVLVLVLLKMGSIGLSMYCFLNRKAGEGDGQWQALLFSTAYAASSYIVAYQYNIFWMDALIFLPLIVWGIEKLVDEQRAAFYIAAIGLAITTNFYTGYMLCIFSVLYFLCYYFLISDEKRRVWTLFSYAGSSLLGGMLSMWAVLPVVNALQNGKTAEDKSLLLQDASKMFGWRSLFAKSFMGTIDSGQMNGGAPLLYCGVLMVLLSGFYLCRGRGPIREKLAYILLLLILVYSFNHKNVYYIWHGVGAPMGCPWRFSFLYAFLMVYIAWRGYVQLSKEKNRGDIVFLAGETVLLFLGMVLCRADFFQMNRRGLWLSNAVVLLVYAGILMCGKYPKLRSGILLTVLCVELFLNAEYMYLTTYKDVPVQTVEFDTYMERVTPSVEQVRKQEGVFRTVMTGDAYRSVNDPFMFNLYGLDSYTSLEVADTQIIGRDFGYMYSILFGMHYGNGATKAAESLLNVEYQISSEHPGGGYALVSEENGIAVYENKNVLPMAFMADESVLALNSEGDSSFQYLEEFYGALDGAKTENIFAEAGHIQTNLPGEEFVEYELVFGGKSESSNEVYVQYSDAGVAAAELDTGGIIVDLQESGETVKRIGTVGSLGTAKLRFYPGEEFKPEQIHIYEERQEILERVAEDIREQNMEISMKNDANLSVRCTNQESDVRYMIFTIPYENGWSAEIDGREQELMKIQRFLAVPIEPGTHEISLRYVSPGFFKGIILSGLAAAVLLFLWRWKR